MANLAHTEIRSRSALVLEDKAEQRARYVATLKDNNFLAEGARNVDEAINLLNRKYYALLWIDLSMDKTPGVLDQEGKKLVLRAKEIGDPCAVIVVTITNESKVTRDYLKDVGASDFVTKRELLELSWGAHIEKIERALDGLRWTENRIEKELKTIYGEDSNFAFDRVRRLNQRVNAADFNKLMRRFVEQGMPFLPKSGNPVLQTDGAKLCGEYWSRGWGRAVELVIGSAEVCDKIGDAVYRDIVARKFGLVAQPTTTRFEAFSS